MTHRGSLEATSNEEQVRRWWTETPNANIALATGHGFFAVDIDFKPDRGVNGFAGLVAT